MAHPEDRPVTAQQGGPSGESTIFSPPGSPGRPLTVGKVLGGRYEIRSVLGRGGMGEVWLARDLKLQVEVALKVVRPDLLTNPLALERLRAEVRSARAVASQHVCRVYDLVEADGGEYVSMEYVDGTTLRDVLDSRSPLELGEAREIALQFLAGLAAIHAAGLVHRDVKPDNLMLTRAGRVVLMDFGIAKAVAAGGTVAGTPAYWAPEQAAGAPADPRADIFAAGVVLAEMVSPGGVRSLETRTALWQGMRTERPEIPDTPWAGAIRKAVARRPEDRCHSAQALAITLEEVALRVTGVGEVRPYPGLSSFTEADAKYFFGRETEVEGIWKRLPQRHLLAVVGPSGAGKSSFLRAGLIPASPDGWGHLICTPGTAPFIALGQALASEIAGDTAAVRQMVRFDDADVAVDLFCRWRKAHAEALLIVDQFEELFTLNAPGVQARFAVLLSRLALDADVHVLLSMRDDFLLRCQEHEGLRPVFSELVPLGPPTGDALRRALVQPAMRAGYRFEDEGLVADMLRSVEGERGALPLLAFAAASLWDRRDREQGVLTRATHDAIGGVAGALAQHAEATLDRIGGDKLPLVRELFRNLVTAQGTRDVRNADELLTVFPGDRRADAGAILKNLIDARLLTSYEAHGSDQRENGARRIEVVHESLLTAWPRLVRWRTEDEGGAQLRDQLRQAARLWDEKGKPDDLLWTGTSYQEYEVWRARYPGGLSETEELFARAMAAAAGRKRLRRRIAIAAAFVVLVGVLVVVGDLLRRTRTALVSADAGRLVALGRSVGVESDATSVLAYAIASLERADSTEGRRLALDAMAHGPIAFVVASEPTSSTAFSADGSRLVVGPSGQNADADGSRLVAGPSAQTRVWDREGRLTKLKVGLPLNGPDVDFAPGADIIITHNGPQPAGPRARTFGAWSFPDGRRLGELQGPPKCFFQILREPARIAALELREGRADVRVVPVDPPAAMTPYSFDMRPRFDNWPTCTVEVAGRKQGWGVDPCFDPRGRWFAFPVGHEVIVQSLAANAPARVLGRHESDVQTLVPSPDGEVIGASDVSGRIRLWSVASGKEIANLDYGSSIPEFQFSDDGRTVVAWGRQALTEGGSVSKSLRVWRLAAGSPQPGREIPLSQGLVWPTTDRAARWVAAGSDSMYCTLWDLAAPADAPPTTLRRGAGGGCGKVSIHPESTWMATADPKEVALWPLPQRAPQVLAGHTNGVGDLAFAPDGSAVISVAKDPSTDVRVWPLAGDPPAASRRLFTWSDALGWATGTAAAPDGSLWAVSTGKGQLMLVPKAGEVRKLQVFGSWFCSIAISGDSRRIAVGGSYPGGQYQKDAKIRILELATGNEITVLDAGDKLAVIGLGFLPDGNLLAGGPSGVRLWDVAAKTFRTLWAPPSADGCVLYLRASTTGRLAFTYGGGQRDGKHFQHFGAYVADLKTGAVRELTSHGDGVGATAIDRTGNFVVTGSTDGIVRVGSFSGEEPHLLIGHTGNVNAVAISPDGKWIASGSEDTTVRLWPMPDMSKPATHALPLSSLLAKLKAQTNLRVIRDDAAPGGYRTKPDAFPGWANLPDPRP